MQFKSSETRKDGNIFWVFIADFIYFYELTKLMTGTVFIKGK